MCQKIIMNLLLSFLHYVFATQQSEKVWLASGEKLSECEYCKIAKKNNTIMSTFLFMHLCFLVWVFKIIINNVVGRKLMPLDWIVLCEYCNSKKLLKKVSGKIFKVMPISILQLSSFVIKQVWIIETYQLKCFVNRLFGRKSNTCFFFSMK